MSRPPFWSDERKAYLRDRWPRRVPGTDILAAINKMDGPTISYSGMGTQAATLGVTRPPDLRGRPPSDDDALFAAACRWEDACDEAGLRFDDIPDTDADRFERRGIMSGPPPDLDRLIEARVAQSRQARRGVGEVFVRGLA